MKSRRVVNPRALAVETNKVSGATDHVCARPGFLRLHTVGHVDVKYDLSDPVGSAISAPLIMIFVSGTSMPTA